MPYDLPERRETRPLPVGTARKLPPPEHRMYGLDCRQALRNAISLRESEQRNAESCMEAARAVVSRGFPQSLVTRTCNMAGAATERRIVYEQMYRPQCEVAYPLPWIENMPSPLWIMANRATVKIRSSIPERAIAVGEGDPRSNRMWLRGPPSGLTAQQSRDAQMIYREPTGATRPMTERERMLAQARKLG